MNMELESDIEYIRNAINEYSRLHRKDYEQENNTDVNFPARMNFVVIQFKNIFHK
ncbi:hypothetical protein IJ182_02170 [bacterium]|nr:hypothetical protein [bacterium]